MKHEKLLRKIASKSTHRTFHHASLVIRGGAIKAYGYNHGEKHAEIMALGKLWPNHRPGTTVINIRIRRNGTLGDAKPCFNCREFMFKMGVRRIIYSNRYGSFSSERITL